jgi:tyrosine-protein kinase Etk/Wzc
MNKVELREEELNRESGTMGSPQPRLILLDIIISVLPHKGKIFKWCIAAAIVSAVVSLLLPKVYVASTLLAPPQEQSSLATAMLGDTKGILGKADFGLKDPNEIYIATLQSRTVADNVIHKFDLQRIYESKTLFDARRTLEKHRRFESSTGSTITITVDDHDPKRAADMANAFADELRVQSSRVATEHAKSKRIFFEQQVGAAFKAYEESGVRLAEVQQKTGILAIEPQMMATIGTVASASALVAAKEIELRAQRAYATADNPDLIRNEQELQGLRARLRELQATGVGGNGKLQVAAKDISKSALEVASRVREFKFNEIVMDLLTKQLEIARLDEGVTPPSIISLDEAVPPEKRTSPRRTLIVVMSVLLTMFIGTMYYAILAVFHEGMVDETVAIRLRTIVEQLGISRFRMRFRKG